LALSQRDALTDETTKPSQGGIMRVIVALVLVAGMAFSAMANEQQAQRDAVSVIIKSLKNEYEMSKSEKRRAAIIQTIKELRSSIN